MKKHLAIALIALGIGGILLSMPTGYVGAERKCGDMKWSDKDHGDNNPSSNEFKHAAYHMSLCELAKAIDHSELANHDKVDWKKFKSSPAYEGASDKQQECLTHAQKDGNGANDLVGYEIMDCGIGHGYDE